jgi:hypothetical protein
MRHATRTSLALALLLGALSALPSSVSAESRHIDQEECSSFEQFFPDGSVHIFTVCARLTGVVQDTATPSGSTIHVFNGSLTQTIAIDGVPQPDLTTTSESHFVTVTKDGTPQVVSNQQTFSFPSSGLRCVSEVQTQFSNGELRFSRFAFNCS